MPIEFLYPSANANLGGRSGYSPLATVFDDREGKVILTHGLHVVVGGASAGKTVGSRGLLYSIAKQIKAPMRAEIFATRESHTAPLPLAWFLQNFLDDSVVAGTIFEDIIATMKKRAPSPFAGPSTSVILIDSITEWMWEVETLAVETLAPSFGMMSAAEKSAAAGAPSEVLKVISRRNSAAKSGGVVGEAIQFLRMLDNSAQLAKRTVIVTINSVTYPLKSNDQRDKDTLSALAAIIKGQVSALMVPSLNKGGSSVMRISTRAEREAFSFALDADCLEKAALEVGQTKTIPTPAVEAKPRFSFSINQKD
jgi:hypothetical protein